jgi:uncharacterized membrane protein YcaP (DUF421 family)
MDSVLRGVIVYAFLLIIFRISGRRTLSEATNFDLVLLLIISETTQQAMVDNDHSITNGFLLIMTLVGTSIVLSLIKQRFPRVEAWLDGTPLVIVQNGKCLQERMSKMRIDEEDILSAARGAHGIERLDQVKYAIVERGGDISIVPRDRQ